MVRNNGRMARTPANMTAEIVRAMISSRGSGGLFGSPASILATSMERRTAMMQKPAETSSQALVLPVTRDQSQGKKSRGELNQHRGNLQQDGDGEVA